MIVAKNEPLRICSQLVSDMSTDSEMAKKYKAEKTITTQISSEENKCAQRVFEKLTLRVIYKFAFVFSVLILPSQKNLKKAFA